jgi:hypothetical protein
MPMDRLTFSMSFVPKLGVLGLLLLGPLMKGQMRKSIGQLVAANRRFVETRSVRGAQAASAMRPQQ